MTPEEVRSARGYELEPLVRAGLAELLRRRVDGQVDIEKIWENALVSETNYWDRVLSRQHKRDSDLFFIRLDNYPDQTFEYTKYLASSETKRYDVLDVGAGPLTVLGSKSAEKTINIVALDPLADHYNSALTKANVTPPIKTILGKGETLLDQFKPDSFHLVHSLNALDHTYDPILCIQNMVSVCRNGGSVLLAGGENVALLNVYGGLHQWNFMPVAGDLIIWRPGQKFSLQRILGANATVNAQSSEDGTRYFVDVKVHKAIATSASPDYAKIYDAVYTSASTYTSSHTSPGLRTALANTHDLESSGRRHLDVGAGPGYLVEVLRMPPFRKKSVGADVSAVAVELANTRLSDQAVFLIKEGRLPFDDSSFDLITCFDVMEHLDPVDVEVLRSEIERVAARGCRILYNISLRDSSLRDQNGESLHRTVKSAHWWDETLGFDSYSVNHKEHELYAKRTVSKT